MNEYQKKRKNPYLLPQPLYMRILYIVRDYERLKDLAEQSEDEDALFETIAIEKSLEKIPEFFRKPIYDNIVSGERYPLGADVRTFQRYKQKFIYFVAKGLGKINNTN